MMLAYGAGALGLMVAGQQGGAEILRQVLDGDPQGFTTVIDEAQRVVGTGMDFGQAAILIAFVPVILRLLQMATPFTETLNLWWRRRVLGDHGRPDQQPPPA